MTVDLTIRLTAYKINSFPSTQIGRFDLSLVTQVKMKEGLLFVLLQLFRLLFIIDSDIMLGAVYLDKTNLCLVLNGTINIISALTMI